MHRLSVGDRPAEEAGYFSVDRAELYTTLHKAAEPFARVLMVGSFAAERHLSYIPWVRWARYLAARDVECLRYDHRGIGESTGGFEELSFADWEQDVEVLGGWLKNQDPDTPVFLHGLEVGGLLAAKAFEHGIGDGLLLWGPPASAHQALRATLLRRVALDNAFKYGNERRPPSDYIQRLENGISVDVDGYGWSGRLWSDSTNWELPAAIATVSDHAGSADGRPTRLVKADKLKAPLVKGSSVGYEAINRNFNALFADNVEWIRAAAKKRGEA